MRQLLGCIADDFTGASDAASFIQNAGVRTMLLNEIPKNIEVPADMEAIVVALKSRTQEKAKAVKSVMDAVKWLKNAGAVKFYFKYCSTFDSTKEGNIGPVADAVMEYLKQDYTILCPALPINGRIVKEGRLYVNGVPLEESPMKNHPLTPMWDSKIKNLMEAQSRYHVIEVHKEELYMEKAVMEARLEKEREAKEPFYIVPDYTEDADGREIARLFGDLQFLTGGSGVLTHLAAHMFKTAERGQKNRKKSDSRNESKGIVLAGSCSIATLGQIEDYQAKGNVSYKINPIDLYEGRQTKQDIIDFIAAHPHDAVLVYSSDTAEKVKEAQKPGREKMAGLIEDTLSDVAVELVKKGFERIVVAGGETSGAVTKALGYDAFEIGESVAPGVPIMTPIGNKNVKIVLKSGNFGQSDFFTRALNMAR